MKPEIIIEIDGKGEKISLEVRGERGRQCLEVTQFLEGVLGELERRSLKSEYFSSRIRTRQTQRVMDPERESRE